MTRLVFMVEEPSMRTLLQELLPRFFPKLDFLCIQHEGKHDLEKSIPRKLRAWAKPDDRFIVLRDNDGGDCVALKKHLDALCRSAGRTDTLIRIVCQELEAWYFGQPEMIASVFDKPEIVAKCRTARFRNPDAIARPSGELTNLCAEYQKVGGARVMATHLSYTKNSSRSFKVFVEGIAKLAGFDLPA